MIIHLKGCKSSNLGTTLINQNSIQEEKSLKSGNACYSVQNLLSSSLLYKNLKVYRTIILPGVYGCETGSLTLREESRRWRIEC